MMAATAIKLNFPCITDDPHIKNISEIIIINLFKELKKLKVELGCKTWAELLAKFVESRKAILDEKKMEEMRNELQNFLKL